MPFNIVPQFPEYSGPHSVGSIDCELPVADLTQVSEVPEGSDIATVAFRVFYPCEKLSSSRPIRWLPSPQKSHFSAYVKFLGVNTIFADGVSLLPHFLYYTTIPALRNAPLLKPTTKEGRWPVMVFSHGLGGSRNAYSHICGSLASHGIIVIAPDHRDHSAPVSFVRATSKTPARVLNYKRYAHTPSPEVYAGRDEQLKIRLWEMGLIHEAIQRIDRGTAPENLDPNSTTWRKNDMNEVLGMFREKMDVRRPGSIIWGGHSFGACTVAQLLKSTYWGPVKGEKAVNNPLFSPAAESSLSKQITPESPAMLLDMWCLPFSSPASEELWERPMPCYAPSGPGGTGVLAILSEAFFKWSSNMSATKTALTSRTPGDTRPGPRFFYPTTSAHLSQSDFGILFPWVTSKILKTEHPPERYVKLNARAVLEVLRDIGYEVAETSQIDREEGIAESKAVATVGGKKGSDWKILDVNGNVPGWMAINVDADASPSHSRASSTPPVETEVLGELS